MHFFFFLQYLSDSSLGTLNKFSNCLTVWDPRQQNHIFFVSVSYLYNLYADICIITQYVLWGGLKGADNKMGPNINP